MFYCPHAKCITQYHAVCSAVLFTSEIAPPNICYCVRQSKINWGRSDTLSQRFTRPRADPRA